jgi:hypothetical protein
VDLKAERAAGKTVLGAVFNLDPHYKGGSHWVALAINLQKNMVYYLQKTNHINYTKIYKVPLQILLVVKQMVI